MGTGTQSAYNIDHYNDVHQFLSLLLVGNIDFEYQVLNRETESLIVQIKQLF